MLQQCCEPAFTSALINDDANTKIILTFSINIVNGTINKEDFSVVLTDTQQQVSNGNISTAVINNGKVELTSLDASPNNSQGITVSYTKHVSDTSRHISDANENALEVLANQTVTNNVTDVVAPTFVSALINDAVDEVLELEQV